MISLDIHAPIVPGKSLGGISLGDHIRDLKPLLDFAVDKEEPTLLPLYWVSYRLLDVVIVQVDIVSGLVDWIGATGHYPGTLLGRIKPGMPIGDVKKEFTGLYWDDVDEICRIADIPGVGLILRNPDMPMDGDLTNPIETICVQPAR